MQLAITVIYFIMVEHLNLISESSFSSFLSTQKVTFGLFKQKVLDLLKHKRYSKEFFSKEKIEEVLKKFQILISMGFVFLIYRSLQVGSVQ